MDDEQPRRRPRSRSRSPDREPKRGRGGFRWKDDRNRGGRRDRDDRDDRRDARKRSTSRERYSHERHGDRDSDRRDRSGPSGTGRDKERDSGGKRREDGRSERKEKKKKPVAAPVAGQEMIIVNINDRLGTKTAIPCLPSDTVGQLKLMVAARIGREPGQIMLKRQGERPFKDIITLEDYGISHGVQLDLEVDTG
ncbi:ubiquitin-like protein, partial [Sarocladium strictum]